MSDLIERQKAIEAIYHHLPLVSMERARIILHEVPSAQPESEERKAESAQNVPKEDLISRKAEIDAIVDCAVYGNADELEEAVMQGNDWNRWSGGVLEALEAVKELPSAKPEITHCKDCKQFGVDRYKKLTWCSRINYGYGYQADDFCSKAERRTDEGD